MAVIASGKKSDQAERQNYNATEPKPHDVQQAAQRAIARWRVGPGNPGVRPRINQVHQKLLLLQRQLGKNEMLATAGGLGHERWNFTFRFSLSQDQRSRRAPGKAQRTIESCRPSVE